MLIAAVKGMPLVESWRVFKGEEHNPLKTAFPPTMILACLKGSEVIGEALPGSCIQFTAILQTDLDEIAWIQVGGIATGLLSAGVVLTTMSLGIERPNMIKSPNNPIYGYIPSVVSKYVKNCVGLCIFSTFSLSQTIIPVSLLYLKEGNLNKVGLMMMGELAAVCSYKHFVEVK